MADCCSLLNAAELVETLRKEARTEVYDTAMLILTAADAIEVARMEIAGLRMRRDELYKKIDQLEDKNAKLKAERDAAVADLKSAADESGECWGCEFMDLRKQTCIHLEKMICNKNNSKWEWRGIKEEAE